MSTGKVFDLPNYAGELFTADAVNTPILSMLGGLTGGGMQTFNFEFPVSSEYDLPTETQPEISEDDSLTAPDATNIEREQVTNVTQIFHQTVDLSYEKLSNYNRLSGINTAGASNNVDDEMAWQIDKNLQIIARNIEHTILKGVFNEATSSDEVNKTRGIFEAAALPGGTVVDAASAELDKDLIQELFREMHDNGALYLNPVILVSGLNKQKITDIYGYAPESRNVGGLDLQQLETDFGNISIAPAHRFMPNDKLAVVEMDLLQPVFQPHPEKGNFFFEELSKDGAAEKGQIYGKFGLDHGPAFAHGLIEDLG